MASLMNQHLGLLTAAVGPAQFAVGRPAALDQMVGEIRTALLVQGHVLLQLDVTAAFNTISRQAALEEAAARARAAGLEVVMDRCMKIEHARFFGGLNTIGINTAVISSRRRPRSPRA